MTFQEWKRVLQCGAHTASRYVSGLAFQNGVDAHFVKGQ